MVATTFSVSLSPLEKVSEVQLQELGQVLWDWSLCDDCKNARCCFDKEQCPSQRSERLARFFGHYKYLTGSYEPNLGPGEHPALLYVFSDCFLCHRDRISGQEICYLSFC